MIFSVSNDGIELSLDFGPDSICLGEKDLIQEMIIGSNAVFLPAWSLLLYQRQDFSNNHPARILFTTNQEGTREMRE